MRIISVVVPAFNEQQVLPEIERRLSIVMQNIDLKYEIIFVNDGSSDNTLNVMRDLKAGSKSIAILNLSRNFGKEIAMTAGIDYAKGDAVVVIDADLQDPPELIPEMIKHWSDGYDVVYARRTSRKGESGLKKLTATLFYRFIQRISHVNIPRNTGDFRLLSRKAADALKGLREHHRFMKGLFAWIGFRQKEIEYVRDARFAGETKWNYWRLWNFALEGITSFTTFPLKMATYIGLSVAIASLGFGILIMVDTLLYGNPVKGYPSLMVVVSFLGGIQLMFIGVIGEYVGRMFDETKGRPLYFIDSYESSDPDS